MSSGGPQQSFEEFKAERYALGTAYQVGEGTATTAEQAKQLQQLAGQCELIGCRTGSDTPLGVTRDGLASAGTEAIEAAVSTLEALNALSKEELVELAVEAVGELDNAVAETINQINILSLQRSIADTQGDTATVEKIDAQVAVLTATGMGAVIKRGLDRVAGKIGDGTPSGDLNAGTRPGATDAEAGYPLDTFNSDNYQDFSLPNQKAREWYNGEVNKIDTNVAPTKENAERISAQRAALKDEARDLMSDQEARKRLDTDNPIKDFNYYEKKYRQQGYEGEELWRRIIEGSTTTNPDVNNRYDIGS